jgi:hypothetical protein
MFMIEFNPLGSDSLHAKISSRAYELFEKRGKTHGLDLRDWLRAEAEVLVEESNCINELCTRLRLSPEATTILESTENDSSKLITMTQGEKLASLMTAGLKIKISHFGVSGKKWEDALNSLRERDLIQHVTSKDGLREYIVATGIQNNNVPHSNSNV